MIRLFVFPPVLAGTPNPGPFCIKLEAALRLAGVPYETVHSARPDKAPKGKMPFVEIDGERVGDSTLILELLKQTRGIDLDAHLTPVEKAQSHALQRLIEERMQVVMAYARWAEPENWTKLRAAFFGGMPFPMRLLLPRMARKRVLHSFVAQGTGRHTRDEIYAFGAADLDAMSIMLGDKPFFFGDKPSLVDVTAFAFIVSIVGPDMESPLKTHANSLANLVAHSERMGEIFASTRPRLALAA